ncbi:hypothetical protein D3C85_988770 [compost metagenome]
MAPTAAVSFEAKIPSGGFGKSNKALATTSPSSKDKLVSVIRLSSTTRLASNNASI